MDGQREGSIASSSSLYQSDSDRSTTLAEFSLGIKRHLDAEDNSPGKKRRLQYSDESNTPIRDLPPGLWQAIFLYLDPMSLGQLILTCKRFCTMLSQPAASTAFPNGKHEVIRSEEIWKNSRKTHRPLMPQPLAGKSELEMWQLIGGRRCQSCQRVNLPRESPPGLWDGGPGEHGIRIVWPFGLRCCGACLQQHSQTDTSLLLSSSSDSVLAPALPFTFLTQSNHMIPSTLMTLPRPETLHVTKNYFQRHIDDMQKELEHIRAGGQPAAAEWIKGLSDKGKSRMKDCARWESFEIQGGFLYLFPEINQPHGSQRPRQHSIRFNGPTEYDTTGNYNMYYAYDGYPQYPPATYEQPWAQVPANANYYNYPPHYPVYSQGPPPSVMPVPLPPPPPPPPPQSQHSAGKSNRDAIEAKQIRKNEIERRCTELDDPIFPSVLQHMESFRAACLISAPMTDSAWEVLKPRLLAQRDAAEQIEVQRQQNLAALQVKIEDRRQRDANQKEIKEVLDREWDEAQKPIRVELSRLADEIIRIEWLDGRSVTKDNSAQFAYDILLKVRTRFYRDIAKEDDIARAAGETIKEDSPDAPPTRKLVLENMKWVFDHKIKSITEQYRKELFLCNGDGCEGNFKFYGFEGVIQHYGAKHTNQFSKGNVIVHWQSAEWPEDLPFHADPAAAREAYFNGVGSTAAMQADGFTRTATITPQIGPQGPFGHPPVTGSYAYPNRSTPSPLIVATSNRPLPYPGSHPAFAQGWSQQNSPQSSYQTSLSKAYEAYSIHTPRSNHSPGKPSRPTNLEATNMSRFAIFGGKSSLPDCKEQSDTDRLDKLAQDVKDYWKFFSDIRGLSDSVRLYVTIFHVISHFKTQFESEPHLELFHVALSSHPAMEMLASVNGLTCKVDAQGGSVTSRSSTSLNRHSLPSFLSLIKQIYIEQAKDDEDSSNRPPAPLLSWVLKMIRLPEGQIISDLLKATGMDDDKLRLMAQAFPEHFPKPLPRIGFIKDPEQAPLIKAEADEFSETSALKETLNAIENAGEDNSSSKQDNESDRLSVRDTDNRKPTSAVLALKSPLPFVNVGEDEYDPAHPAIQTQSKSFVRRTRRRRSHSSERFEPSGPPRSRLYQVDPLEVYDAYYNPLPPNEYVRAIPVSPRQARAVRYYYPENSEFDYIPVEREYTRRGPPSPRLYYREDTVRMASDGSRFHESDSYVRPTSRSNYGDNGRHISALGSERKTTSQGRYVESTSREVMPAVARDHALEADAGYRSRSNLRSEMAVTSLIAHSDAAHDAHGSLASGAPTPAPPAPPSGGLSPSEPPTQREARLASLDSGYRGRSLVHDPSIGDLQDSPRALLKASFSEHSRRGDVFGRNHSSKYGRYEAQRRRLLHEQSQSPPRHAPVAHSEGEIRYVRDRDVYYEPEPRYVRVDDRSRGYSPPVVRYLPGDTYLDEYGRPFEYVRVRESYHQPRYVSGRSGVEYAPPPPPPPPSQYEREHAGTAPGGKTLEGHHYVPYASSSTRRRSEQMKKSNPNSEIEEEDYEPPNVIGLRKG